MAGVIPADVLATIELAGSDCLLSRADVAAMLKAMRPSSWRDDECDKLLLPVVDGSGHISLRDFLQWIYGVRRSGQELAVPTAEAFNLKPSVGTWLMCRGSSRRLAKSAGEAAQASAPSLRSVRERSPRQPGSVDRRPLSVDSCSAAYWRSLHGKFQPLSADVAVVDAPPRGLVSVLPFAEYSRESLVSCPPAYWRALHGKFTQVSKPCGAVKNNASALVQEFDELTQQTRLAKKEFEELTKQAKEAMISLRSMRALPPSQPVSIALRPCNFDSCPADYWRSLHRKFQQGAAQSPPQMTSERVGNHLLPSTDYSQLNLVSCPTAYWCSLHAKFQDVSQPGAAVEVCNGAPPPRPYQTSMSSSCTGNVKEEKADIRPWTATSSTAEFDDLHRHSKDAMHASLYSDPREEEYAEAAVQLAISTVEAAQASSMSLQSVHASSPRRPVSFALRSCDFASCSADTWRSLHMKFQKVPKLNAGQVVEKLAPAPAVEAAQASSMSLKSVHASSPRQPVSVALRPCDFVACPANYWLSLHGKFQQVPKPTAMKGAEEFASASAAEASQASRTMKSVRFDALAPPASVKANVASCPAAYWRSLHGKFQHVPKAVVPVATQALPRSSAKPVTGYGEVGVVSSAKNASASQLAGIRPASASRSSASSPVHPVDALQAQLKRVPSPPSQFKVATGAEVFVPFAPPKIMEEVDEAATNASDASTVAEFGELTKQARNAMMSSLYTSTE